MICFCWIVLTVFVYILDPLDICLEGVDNTFTKVVLFFMYMCIMPIMIIGLLVFIIGCLASKISLGRNKDND